MKKDKVLTGIIIGSIIGFLIVLISIVRPIINFRKLKQEKLSKVPIATITLESNTLITDDVITFKNVKEMDIPDNIIYNINDIVGKCLKEGVTIEESSYIKKSQLEDCKNIAK